MNTLYEKTEKGYILRQRIASAVVVICVICVGIIVTCEELIERVADKLRPLNVWWVVIGGFCACVAVVAVILRSECGHMIVAEEGVYLRRPLARTKFIAWENVRDWGFAYHRTRHSRVYDLYFSTESLTATRNGKNKKVPMTYRKVMYITVELDDLSFLKQTGVIHFCRQHLRGGSFVPMFVCDVAEAYIL